MNRGEGGKKEEKGEKERKIVERKRSEHEQGRMLANAEQG